MEKVLLTRAEVKKQFIEKIEIFILHQTQKKEAVLSSQTSFSLQRYNGMGTKLQLKIKYHKLIIRVFTNGKINLSHYDTFYNTEDTLEITPEFEDEELSQEDVGHFIQRTKEFVRNTIK